MKAVITGAAGFVGRHLARHLHERGDQLLLSDRAVESLGSGNIQSRAAEYSSIAWDIREPAPPHVAQHIADFSPDVIYHLAAISIPADCGSSGPSPLAFAVNVQGTANLLALAVSVTPLPRVLVVSSAHVYAPLNQKAPFVTENSRLKPINAYGATKLAAENIAHQASATGLPIIIARAFNHTGPGQPDRLMLPEWCRKFAAGDDPVVVQCRNAWLDLIDARDVVRAYRLLVEHGHVGEIYNVGGGIACRSGDILDQLARIADPNRRIQELDPRPRHQPIADISRLTAATGWKPQIDVKTTISETYAYWQARFASQLKFRPAA